MIVYRYTEVSVSEEDRKVAKLGAEYAARRSGLDYVPRVRFFQPRPHGEYERLCSNLLGFIDPLPNGRCDVLVRAGRSPVETIETIYHEIDHIRTLSPFQTEMEAEKSAHRFTLGAPVGQWRDHSDVYSELASRLIHHYLRAAAADDAQEKPPWEKPHSPNLEAARRIHAQWLGIYREAASEFTDELLSDEERRIRTKLEAQRSRRQTLMEVRAKEAQEKLARLDSTFDPVLEQAERRREEEQRRRRERDERWVETGRW
jgi:hypothetical protein